MARNTSANANERVLWLIDLMSQERWDKGKARYVTGVTKKEIEDAWADNEDLNPKGESLKERTFRNHIEVIGRDYKLKVECKKEFIKVDDHSLKNVYDYKYYIQPSDDLTYVKRQIARMKDTRLDETLWKRPVVHKSVVYEPEPEINYEWVTMIARAIEEKRIIRLWYKKFEETDEEVEPRDLIPYCLKEFKHRWYLVTKNARDEWRHFALDSRTLKIEMTDQNFDYPKSFNPREHFRNSFGVVPGLPEEIRVKAFGIEVDYLRSVPLHPSQTEIEKGEGYAIFKYNLYPYAWEFKQELFSRIDQIEVLAPKKLRDEMLNYINKVKALYEK